MSLNCSKFYHKYFITLCILQYFILNNNNYYFNAFNINLGNIKCNSQSILLFSLHCES